jgi:hypothetical protein
MNLIQSYRLIPGVFISTEFIFPRLITEGSCYQTVPTGMFDGILEIIAMGVYNVFITKFRRRIMKDNYVYILRYTVQPGHHEEKRMDELVSFCKKARIDDVMFFINCEELNQGHLSIEETQPWMEVIACGKERLEPLGITTSINPWPTLLHCDRGRKLKEGQDFRLMVDPYGNNANAVVCPLCSEFQKYITEMYAYYASIKPNMLWVEDDFRLHNHGPLSWGGCFCEAHMEEYSRRAGRKLTREEFVEGVLKPGNPHLYRKIWLDTARETMVKLAQSIGESVHKVSPTTRVGLMSSNPEVHCAEGRDWKGILGGLAAGMPMVNRPTLPAYSDCTPQDYLWNFSTISRMSRAVVPGQTEVYPELENFPFTRFSKSNTFVRYQLETSSVLGAAGITMNIFNMMGSGVMMREGYQDVLADSKDFLSNIKGLKLEVGKQEGIKVLVSPESSYTIHTGEGRSMEELYPQEGFWAGLLSSFGIANTYSLDKRHNDSIVAVSGQYFRNLNKSELKDLFENNFVLMEAEAAYTLYEMGYGELAGIRNVVWHAEDSGFQAYEQVCDGKAYCGIDEARMSSQALAGDFLEIEYINEPVLKTMVKNPYGETVSAGTAVYENRVFILPYGRFNGRFQSHLNPFRQEILQDAIKGAETCSYPVFAEGNPYVSVLLYHMDDKKVIILFNASLDKLDTVKIYAPEVSISGAMELNRFSTGMVEANVSREGDYIVLNRGLAGMEMKALVLC